MTAAGKPIRLRRRVLTMAALCAPVVGGAIPVLGSAGAPTTRELRERLAVALAHEDTAAVDSAVAALTVQYGDQAGVPEAPDEHLPIPRNSAWLTAAEAAQGFEPLFEKLEASRWWRIGLDPMTLGHALREPAAVLSGLVAAARARLRRADRSLDLARKAADFLVWAQQRAGTGVFPFPASRGAARSRAFKSAQKLLRRADQEGRLATTMNSGWVIDDAGEGGLQFDNTEAGAALLALYAFTRDERYLDAATKKALLGVIPGQLRSGPLAGRWHNPRNARRAYHNILLRSLAELAIAFACGPRRPPKRAIGAAPGLEGAQPGFPRTRGPQPGLGDGDAVDREPRVCARQAVPCRDLVRRSAGRVGEAGLGPRATRTHGTGPGILGSVP